MNEEEKAECKKLRELGAGIRRDPVRGLDALREAARADPRGYGPFDGGRGASG